MAEVYKVLAQSVAFPDVSTDIYTVPSAREAVISTLIVANRGSSTSLGYTIWVVPSGETLANKHILVKDFTLPVGESTIVTIGITLSAGDKVVVLTSSTSLSFNVFGVEYS